MHKNTKMGRRLHRMTESARLAHMLLCFRMDVEYREITPKQRYHEVRWLFHRLSRDQRRAFLREMDPVFAEYVGCPGLVRGK